jgi:hypothetical protein
MADTRIIRNMRKVTATIHNAQAFIEIEREFGSFATYLETMRPFESQMKDLQKRCKHLGTFGCYYFLYVVGEDVPPHDEYTAKLKGNPPPDSRQRMKT